MYFFNIVFKEVVAQRYAGESAVGDAFFKTCLIEFFIKDPAAVFSKPAKTRKQVGADRFFKQTVCGGGDGMMRVKINRARVVKAFLNAVV